MDKQLIDDLEFTNGWTMRLLEQLEMLRSNDKKACDIEKAIGECSLFCFKKNGFDEKLQGFSGLKDYLKFCETDLGWKVDYDENAGVIMCYEQNDACLCPIVRVNEGKVSPSICCCTQGEIRRMFQYALKQAVDVDIVHSIVRDEKRCVYKVTLKENEKE